jgi:cell filamentation protein
VTVDPYLEPGTSVLRNVLGIRDPARLAQAEADLSLAAIQDLGTRDLPGAYDLDHLRAFHREIFGDLYPWAGELRTVAIAKTDWFCLPQHLVSYSAEVFDALAGEAHLCDLDREAFVDRLTHYFAEVNAIHPFREGNGRTQRAFFGQLARHADWPIDWSRLDPVRNTEASIASLRGDNGALRALFDDLIEQ